MSQLISNRQLSLSTHMTSPILELSLVITALRRVVIFVLVSTSADREFNRTTAAKEGIGEEYSSNLGSILKTVGWIIESSTTEAVSEALAGVFCPKCQVQLSKS